MTDLKVDGKHGRKALSEKLGSRAPLSLGCLPFYDFYYNLNFIPAGKDRKLEWYFLGSYANVRDHYEGILQVHLCFYMLG